MNQNKLGLRLTREKDGYNFPISSLGENTRRRKLQPVRASFLEAQSGRPLALPADARLKEYRDEGGNFRFVMQVRMERNVIRDYPLFVPFALFELLQRGMHLLLAVERLEDDGSVSARGELPLLLGADGQLSPYSDEAYAAALRALAQEGTDGAAEMRLYRLYTQPGFSLADEEEAQGWLRAAAGKGSAEAAGILKAAEPPEPEETYPPDSFEALVHRAEKGDAAAQMQLYCLCREPGEHGDEAKALDWLQRAARGGLDEAVRELETYYLENFLVDGDNAPFLEALEEGAENGSAAALMGLFGAYYSGECLRRPAHRDKKRALDYLQRAAQGGDVEACYRMWQLFEDGNDLLIGEKDAAAMLQRAADGGSAEAKNDLGELYVTGRIVEKDNARGLELIRAAAEDGCFGAQMRQFQMCYDGRYYDALLETDRKKAYRLLSRFAREDGNPMAQTLLWNLYTDRNPVMLTRLEALDSLRRAAEASYTPAMFLLARADLDGRYKDIDPAEGFDLLKGAAKLGSGEAQLALFELYYTGKYLALQCPVNKERAYKWLTRSAVTDAEALYRMWELFENGNEMELEPADALEMLFSSVGKGCADALYAAAALFAGGERVPPDLGRALKYLVRASEQGHAKSMYRLYEIYTAGRFGEREVQQDAALAKRMLLLSAQLSYAPACAEVCRLFDECNPIGVDRTFADECRAHLPEGCCAAPPKAAAEPAAAVGEAKA